MAHEAVQRMSIRIRGRRADAVRGGVVLHRHRPARRIVAVVLVRGDGRRTHGSERGEGRYGDARRVDAKPAQHRSPSIRSTDVSLTRRQFLWSAAASTAALGSPNLSAGGLAPPKLREGRWPLVLGAQTVGDASTGVFRHGVASGDPLADRVILWTRVTPPDGGASTPAVDVRWRIAGDPALAQPVAQGTVRTTGERDFTVKVDAGGLQPGRPYYYAFETGGERSPVGRTRTLPAGVVDRVRLASVCCSNYPSGFFNVYRCLANR